MTSFIGLPSSSSIHSLEKARPIDYVGELTSDEAGELDAALSLALALPVALDDTDPKSWHLNVTLDQHRKTSRVFMGMDE